MMISPAAPVQPLFLGGHPAMDFLNTRFGPEGRQKETIGSGRALLAWLVAAKLLDAATAARLSRRLGDEVLDAAAAEARRFREWARGWLARWRTAPRRDYADELAVLNKLLARETCHHQVLAEGRDLKWVARPRLDNADALIALIAAQVAALVTAENASLVRSCAGPDCSLWFLDRSKAHRRMFCSAAACGNRAKVAAFRARSSR
jgi:predicted RNA-binding Zn ribbon-like protein